MIVVLARPQRRRGLALLVALAVLVAVWLAWCAATILSGERLASAGLAAARQARSGVHFSQLDTPAAGASSELDRAARDVSAAHGRLSAFYLDPLRVVPWVGTQLASARDLTGAAATVLGAGSSDLATARRLLATHPATPAERAALVESLAGVLGGFDRQLHGVRLGPSHGLLHALAAKRATVAAELSQVTAGVDRVSGAMSALADLVSGSRTYLLIAANNAEMRAGSGMALQLGSFSAAGGKLALGPLRPAVSLVERSSPLSAPGYLGALWGFEHPTLDFRDLFLSPQFPANAALAAAMWQQRTGQHVDGVLVVDDQAVADLIGATGPVSAGGVTLTAAGADRYLLQTQYRGIRNGDPANLQRRERLGLLAGAALHRLSAPSTSLPAVATALERAAAGRHILAWSPDPAIEADWMRAGVGGAVTGNSLLLSLLNQGANKLDPYQSVTAHLATHVAGAATVVTVTVTDRNLTPPGLSGYAAGGAPGLPPARVYTGAIALDFPARAGRASVLGRTRYEASGPDGGTDVLAVPVVVPDRGSVTVTFSFTLSGAHGELTVDPSARLPPTTWTASGRTWTDAVQHHYSW